MSIRDIASMSIKFEMSLEEVKASASLLILKGTRFDVTVQLVVFNESTGKFSTVRRIRAIIANTPTIVGIASEKSIHDRCVARVGKFTPSDIRQSFKAYT